MKLRVLKGNYFLDKTRAIFITGLHRSGTTILNMILGANSQCIAVGEVDTVIRAGQERERIEGNYKSCTCGQCEFWPEVMENIDKAGTDDLQKRYSIFLDVFRKKFPGKIPVDSSKHLDALQALRSLSDCQAVRIVRDVRGWCVSQSGRITPRDMILWYKKNKRLEKSASDALLVGYEPLVLAQDDQVRRLCESLGLDYEKDMLSLHDGTGHILFGNRMRSDKEQKIRYDGRWMMASAFWPALLFPVMKYNQRQVYN